jgi:FKBP-type peptidyl-prolyl cis-trans isomerase
MKVKPTLAFILVVVILSSCWNRSKFKGYTRTDSGLHYKLQVIGEGKKHPKPGDYLQLMITYKTEKDSVFLDTYSNNETGKVILPYQHSSFEGSFEEGLTMLNDGDSVSFIVNADSLFTKFFNSERPMFLGPDSYVKMDVKLCKILNQKEYEEEMNKYKEMVEDRDIEEHRKLKVFLDTCKTTFYPLNDGMLYLPLKQGTGDMAEKGNIVKINYKGYFLNGKVFESTYERGEPLEFVLGTQQQVIKGIERAVRLMNEGAKTKFIIPSQLAFGESGSTTGIVPPYTTVIYEIEMLSLTKYNN